MESTMDTYIKSLIDNPALPVVIMSGEGDGPGHIEIFTGKRTIRAIKARLTRERCCGDRWANAWVFSGITLDGDDDGMIFCSLGPMYDQRTINRRFISG